METFAGQQPGITADDPRLIATSIPEPMSTLLRRAKRRLLQMHFEARVGHLGGNLSCLDSLLVLQHRVLQENDTFVLSKGHATKFIEPAIEALPGVRDLAVAVYVMVGARNTSRTAGPRLLS